VRCKVCGHTHSLLPDFLHLYRHYVIRLLQHMVSLYLNVGRKEQKDCWLSGVSSFTL